MRYLFANNANGELSSALTAGQTTLTLVGGQGDRFPFVGTNQRFRGTLFTKLQDGKEDRVEIVEVTARSGDTLTIVRDVEAMTGQPGGYSYSPTASSPVYFELRLTAGVMDDVLQEEDVPRFDPAGSAASALSGHVSAPDPHSQYQGKLVSGVSIKTVGGQTVLGSGDIPVRPVSPPTIVTAHGAENALTINNDFSATNWAASGCTVRDNGDGWWALRAEGDPGVNAYIYHAGDGLEQGQWYTAVINIRISADVTDSVVLWARDSSGYTMAVASIGPSDSIQTLSISFRATGADGKYALIVDPGPMTPGRDMYLARLRVYPGGSVATLLARDNRAGYPTKAGVGVYYVNYEDIGRLPAPDGTPTAVRVRQQAPGNNAYLYWVVPGAAQDKVPLTASVWINPVSPGDFALKLATDTQTIAQGQLVDLPVNQWSRVSLRGVFAEAQGANVNVFIDSSHDTTPGGVMDFRCWGLVLEPDSSFTPFASLPAQSVHNVAIGGHVVIDGPGTAAIFGPPAAAPGDVLWITVANNRNDNVFWGGAIPVMGRDETLQLDMGRGTYKFVYVDNQRGWWIV